MAMFAVDEEINLASDDESVDNFGLNESFENETEEVKEDGNTDFNVCADVELVEPSSSNSWSEVPKLQMIFDTDESAYHYYNAYAKKVGFSIRRKTMYKRAGKVQGRVLCCSREGQYSKKLTPKKKRDSKRCSCLAMFEVKRAENDKYVLTVFVKDHNHPLESAETSHLLRSHRQIEPSQAGLIKNMRSSGIRTSSIFSYLSNEAGGAENLNFTQSNCYNFVSKTRTEFLCRGDTQCLLEYLTKKQEANKSYFYKLRMDENRICSCFISDPKSRCDYANFGDVVCFDTTYKTNNYKMICAPIIGVNHHAQTVIFGCGLLDCETTDSFVWLFQTFLTAMGGKKPQTIFTDQAGAIANAVKNVFPTTHHRLCLWHIYQNAAKNLSNVFSQFQTFSKDLKNCIYDSETVDEFEECWDQLLGKYGLHDNAWLQNLYQLKEKWAQVYVRSHFCAGMTTTQRSESINKFLKCFFSGNLILREFVAQFDRALADRRMKERQADTRTRQAKPNLFTEWGVEREASIKYTRKIFQLFQDEIKKGIILKCRLVNDDGTTCSYNVRDMGKQCARPHTLTYIASDSSISCSCRKFEFHGILCAHILKFFLDELEVSSLPSQYFLPRWCVHATSSLVYDGNGDVINSDLDSLASRRYSELMYFAQMLAAKGAITDEKCALAKSEMLNVIVKLDSIQINDEQGKTQHDSNTLNYDDQVEKRNSSVESRNLTLLDPVRKKRTGEAKGGLKNALEKRPTPKRKTTSKTSELVPVVQPNQDLNFPGYSSNESNVRYSTFQVGHIGRPLMPSDHPFIYNQGMQGSSHLMNFLIGQPTTTTQCSQSIDASMPPAKRLDFTNYSVSERGAGHLSLDPAL